MCLEFLDSFSTLLTNFPNYDNYVMSASALLRLQDTYDLETTIIASGLVGSANASSPSMSGASKICIQFSWIVFLPVRHLLNEVGAVFPLSVCVCPYVCLSVRDVRLSIFVTRSAKCPTRSDDYKQNTNPIPPDELSMTPEVEFSGYSIGYRVFHPTQPDPL